MSHNSKQKQSNKLAAKSIALSWTDEGWEDYLWWQKNNPKMVNEINHLLKECLRNPFKGTGKPEPLTGDMTGLWSRRITDKDRLVYLPENGQIYVLMCRFHYK